MTEEDLKRWKSEKNGRGYQISQDTPGVTSGVCVSLKWHSGNDIRYFDSFGPTVELTIEHALMIFPKMLKDYPEGRKIIRPKPIE